jgi:hypothetical protein
MAPDFPSFDWSHVENILMIWRAIGLQDQLCVQMISLMDKLLKRENLDLKLTPYKVLATGTDSGMVEYVQSYTLASVLVDHKTIARFLSQHNPDPAGPFGMQVGKQNTNYLSYNILTTHIHICSLVYSPIYSSVIHLYVHLFIHLYIHLYVDLYIPLYTGGGPGHVPEELRGLLRDHLHHRGGRPPPGQPHADRGRQAVPHRLRVHLDPL